MATDGFLLCVNALVRQTREKRDDDDDDDTDDDDTRRGDEEDRGETDKSPYSRRTRARADAAAAAITA